MRAGLGQRAARWMASHPGWILCAGVLCVVGGAWVYAGPALLDAWDEGGGLPVLLLQGEPPADAVAEPRATEGLGGEHIGRIVAEEREPASSVNNLAAVKNLASAALAVLGTILMSVGAVFALLRPIGVLAADAPQRHGVPAPHAAPASRERGPERGAVTAAGADPLQVPAADAGRPIRPGAVARGASAGRDADVAGGAHLRPARAADVGPPGARPAPGGAEEARPGSAWPDAADGREREAPTAFASEQRPRSIAPPTEAAAPPQAVEERSAQVPQPSDLIAAWGDYRRAGDGHFSRRGLQGVLDERGFTTAVRDGRLVGAGSAVLIVETPPGSLHFYVLPSFNKSPRAVSEWFDDGSDGTLTGRTQRVTRIARGRWVEAGAAGGGRFGDGAARADRRVLVEGGAAAGGRSFEVTAKGEVT